MNRFLSITNLIWPLFAIHTAVLAQSVDLPVVRQKGASLDASIAQEADHAMRLAREWLRNNPPANTETQTCALVQLALESAAPSTNLATLAATAGSYAWTNQAQALLTGFITAYPPKQSDPKTLCLWSRVFNIFNRGVVLRNTEVLDWRNDFANLLISSQRRDASGGAYWEDSRLDPKDSKSIPESLMLARIRATAYGILALKEIHE